MYKTLLAGFDDSQASKILDGAKGLASDNGVTIKTEMRDSYASGKILDAAADLKNDLIVMGSYGWQGVNKAIMGSTTERVLINAPCPVRAVR